MKNQLKYKPLTDNLTAIEKYARHGLSDKEISRLLGIGEPLYKEYMKKYPEFQLKVKNAKVQADIDIEEAVYTRAKGYLTTEEHEIYVPAGEDGSSLKLKERRFVKKFVPPDASNALIWLFNRKSGSWSKNPAAGNALSNEEFAILKDLTAEAALQNM